MRARNFLVTAARCVVALTMVGSAFAGAIISNGTIALGVNDQGHLNFTPTAGQTVNPRGAGVGVTLVGYGDATYPGCLCEGWGAAADGISGYANVSVDGVVNLTTVTFASTATTATSVTKLTSLPGLQVTHAYAPSVTSALYQATVTLTNTTGAAMTDLRYTRVMDWDIPRTEFSELVSIGGLPATNVLFTSNNGFASANPFGFGRGGIFGCGVNVNFTDCGPADHGALFDFGFGGLAAGESKTFTIFYGATLSTSAAFAALGAVGAEVWSFGKQDPSSPFFEDDRFADVTFIFGFKGVGGTPIEPIPEPGTVSLMLGGLAAIALGYRRKMAKNRN